VRVKAAAARCPAEPGTSLLVLIGNLAIFVGFKEQDLAEAFIRVNLRGEWRGIADFECDEAFPFWLKRRDVHDDPATGIGGFAEADGEDVSRNAEVLNRTAQRERVGRN